VEYFSAGFSACNVMDAAFADFSEEFRHVVFLKVDVSQLPNESKQQGVQFPPTFKLYQNGKVLGTVEAASPAAVRNLLGIAHVLLYHN